MQPDFSESTYGFACTYELVNACSLRKVPIFPTLHEEGQSGGGFDVKVDFLGYPLFLQFQGRL
ncbi:MAG: hypothetical protein PHI24_09275 [Desulfitobacteriaceae bacterium]|nr:hypothetical protein [Desulfitobacteriaceae bacterium]